MDNAVRGEKFVEKAFEYYAECKSLFGECQMNMREWFSNSPELMKLIPEKDRGKGDKTSVLGLLWDILKDQLSVKGSEKLEISATTKRQVLHTIARIFDPLGFFNPLTVKAKLYIQRLWKEKFEWNAEVTEEKQKEWALIVTEFHQISTIPIPRYVGIESQESISFELICFNDASPQAYATAVYLKITSGNSACVNLMFSKSKLAPMNKTNKKREISLPRLELMAVVIGKRCLKFVEKELYKLKMSNLVLVTDSECVIHWVKTTKPLSVFVENRLKEIKTANQFRFGMWRQRTT